MDKKLLKKTKRYIVLLSLSFSLNAFALGLGELNVHSSLGQPFDAEIELIDVENTPLADIKANLASTEDYQRLGLDRLILTIEEDKHGQPIVKVHSIERISDPYIQLLVDLVWMKGQVYREYTVLLDPPGYDLFVKQKIGHIVRKRIAADPGTVNREAYESTLPAVPVFSQPIVSSNSAEVDVIASAIGSIRKSNAWLKEQLQLLQVQNENLQEQFNKQHAEIAVLHTQLERLLKQQAASN